jgi:colanic acid/amylovoran biosynthesis glycosyltransferase
VKPLRVVHSLPTWLPLTATWLYNQVRYLSQDIESHIACKATENLDCFDLTRIHSLAKVPKWKSLCRKWRHGGGWSRYMAHLAFVSRHYHCRILHSHWGDFAWKDLPVAQELGMTHVVSFYGKDVGFYPRQNAKAKERYRRLFDQADLVLCEGPHMASCIVAQGCPKEKVRVQHLGIEVAKLPFRPRVWSGEGSLRVLIAGSFREKKGIPDALRSLGLVKDEFPQLEVSIIGDASGDPRSVVEKVRIMDAVRESGLGSRCRLLGYQPYAVLLEEAYRHHIFMSPSLTASDGDTEGGAPVTLIEMAATGMAVLATRHCDIPSVVLEGRTGLLVEERDVEGLAAGIRWLAAHPERWCEMTELARERVESEYDVVKETAKLAEIYANLG